MSFKVISVVVSELYLKFSRLASQQEMLIYLLFIFTCGWCVCYLLFLNYQQHARDSEQRAPSGRECLRRVRRRLRPARHKLDAELATPAAIRQESVVDQAGECSLLVADCCDPIDAFSFSDHYDDELLAWSASHAARSQEPELRGWPAWDQSIDDDDDDGDDDADDGYDERVPLVELHENPLGTCAELGRAGVESAELALRRSQLLSLQSSQQDKRAAIRLVSRWAPLCHVHALFFARRRWPR